MKVFKPAIPLGKKNLDIDAQFRNVSQLYEKQFLREMVKAMRSTIQEGGFIQTNNAEKIFREQLDEQYVEKWGDKGGIGLSDLIYQQLQEKFGQRMAQMKNFGRPKGPLPVNRESEFKVKTRASDNGIQMQIQPLKQQQPQSPQLQPQNQQHSVETKQNQGVSILMPWDGEIIKSYDLKQGDGFADVQKVLEIQHDQNIKSQFILPSTKEISSVGDVISAGDPIAQLRNSDLGFFWGSRS